MPELNAKQTRFVAEYLIDGNATQAAIRAGYASANADVTGPRLLGNVGVAAAIAVKQAKINGKLEITAEKVLRDIEEARIAALADGQYSAAIKASELQGKSLPGGMFTDNHNNNNTNAPRSALDRARRIAFLFARAEREKQGKGQPANSKSNGIPAK